MEIFNKILVTGATGVLGKAIESISKQYPNYNFLFLSSKDCNLINFDNTLDVFSKYRPDAILHLAAISGGIGLSAKFQATLLRDNALITFSVLEAARKLKVKKTIMTLSTGMYPVSAPLPLREESMHDGYPHHSNYGYSFAKRLIDPLIKAYREQYNMNVIGLIPSGIFGEEDNFNPEESTMLLSLVRRFYENKNTSDPITVWGDGKPLREFTYAKDLAKIYLWALENYNESQCLHIGTTEENSIKDIALMIADSMGIDKSRIIFDTSKPSGIHRKNTDNSKFLKISNFRYTPFREALNNTIKWFDQMNKNSPEKINVKRKFKIEG